MTHKQHTQFNQGNNCGYCGSQQQPRKCPAYGVICSKCKGKNHLAKVWRGGKYTKKVYQVETEHVDNNDDSSNYIFLGTVTEGNNDIAYGLNSTQALRPMCCR